MSEIGILGPVSPVAKDFSKSLPLALNEVTLSEKGDLGGWQIHNAKTTIPHLIDNLISTGALANLQDVGTPKFKFRGMWFSDSDVHKSLEALCWSQYLYSDTAQKDFLKKATAAIAYAQEEDGYVNSYFQGVKTNQRWSNFGWGHELYTAGHLIQAAIAESRVLKDAPLMTIATKFADLLVSKFSAPGSLQMCGHPEIETALIELYRETKNDSYLDLAEKMILGRGFSKISNKEDPGFMPSASSYMQDHINVHEATTAVGHSVRQLYLNAAVMDLYAEKGDAGLLKAQEAMWEDMVYTKMYVTGGLGSRHKDEAFGDSFELPNDRAYAETCASIANFMWSWRLLLATGKSRYADVMELSLYNNIAGSVSSDGCKFFYSNPLQYRTGHFTAFDTDASERLSWYTCSCCPPNIGRIVATLQHYIASTKNDAFALHLYTEGSINAILASGAKVGLEISTEYPKNGVVKIAVTETGTYTLQLRIPDWCKDHSLSVNGTELSEKADLLGYINISRDWVSGDFIDFDLKMTAEFLKPHPRIDAARGCVSLRKGPVIFAIEQADVKDDGYFVDDFNVDSNADIRETEVLINGFGNVLALELSGHFETFVKSATYPYVNPLPVEQSPKSFITAIPYSRWGNRIKGGMRVWIPAQR
jgi:DUF1680 family protein